MTKPEQQLNPHKPKTLEFWIWNCNSAITMMRSVPEENVELSCFRDDDKPVNASPTCGTIACLGGWCALWPPFRSLGVKAGNYGAPILSDYYGSSYAARNYLFGPPPVDRKWGLFEARSDHEYAGQTDKQAAISRLRKHKRWLQTRLKARADAKP